MADEWDTSSESFLKFDYVETKDLAKSFLTLVAAVLVFAVTFSDKIVNFPNAGIRERWLIGGSWIALLVSTASCGVGVYFIFNAGLAATHLPKDDLYWRRALIAYRALHIAGGLFVIGLGLLVASAASSLHWL